MYEIIPGRKQNHWRWSVVLNFFLGGTGAGLYILVFLFGRYMALEGLAGTHFLKLLSPALAAAGLLAVAAEAGRPLRGLHLFANIRHSWISREIFFAAVFISLSLAGRLISSKILSLFAAGAAVLFVISQAMILYRSFAVPAWRQQLLPLFFLSSALLNGFGLFLFLKWLNLYYVHHYFTIEISILAYGTICVFSTLAVWSWMSYIRWNKERVQAFPSFRSNLLREIMIGGLLPLLILAGIAFQSSYSGMPMTMAMYALCSAIILFSGYYRLHKMISGVNYLKPVVLDQA